MYQEVQDPFIGFGSCHEPEPLVDGENAPFGEKWLFQERLKAYVSRENQLKDNIVKVYGLVWRQCTSALQAVLKGHEGYTLCATTHDLVWILTEIKKVVSGVDVKANSHDTLFDALQTLFNMRQQQNESNDHYLERFNSNVHTVDMAKGGHIFCSHELIECEDQDSITDHKKKVVEEKLKSIIFLRRSNDTRYKDLATDLKKGSYLGRDEYPKTVSGT